LNSEFQILSQDYSRKRDKGYEIECGSRTELRLRAEGYRACEELSAAREFVVARQLLKSGTSIGANVEEALAGQSRADFLAKLSIASKEARECNYWLRLIRDSEMATAPRVQPLLDDSEELIRLLTVIVRTTAKDR
jgi:four helix bundle protein